jgi:uncharacterized caspase-like protein
LLEPTPEKASDVEAEEVKPINTLIAYAAKAGFAAEDGDREHSPFTESLLKHLFEPGRDIRFAFGYIRNEVYESTGRTQRAVRLWLARR